MAVEAKILDNDSRVIGEVLGECLDRSTSADVAVAFARRSGLQELGSLPAFQDRGGRLRFLAGSDFEQTEIELLDDLEKRPGAEVKMRFSAEASAADRIFHPKIYVCREGERVSAIVGSANFTRGGLRTNVETAVLLSGESTEPVLRDLSETFDRHWQSPLAVPLSDKLRQDYGSARRERLEALAEALERGRLAETGNRLRHAMAELLAPSAQGTRTWLLITSQTNYGLCLGGRLWGDDKRPRIEQMRVHDRVIFYMKGIHQLGAAGLVAGPVFEARAPYWPDGPYRYRLRLEILLHPMILVPFKPLLPQLVGFPKGRSWGTFLQRSSAELRHEDAATLWNAVSVAAKPTSTMHSGLLVAEDGITRKPS